MFAEKAEKLVVVVQAGSAIDMSAWIDKVSAVVYTGFAGESINCALANILCGKVNPSGRLAETFSLCIEDTPMGKNVDNGYVDRYKEGVLVGYRYYLTNKVPVLFPFGYGLSYSQFKYDNFKCEKTGEKQYKVSFRLTNDSQVAGAEVCQLYVDNIDMQVERPLRELRRFTKVFLNPHESKIVQFDVNYDCFAYFNVCYNAWHVDSGRYAISVCKNACEVIFKEKVKI